jgi:uncharacterized RDD family membrane protein YckC
MDDQLTISTPEQVAFHYEVAGIGSRFLAALLDHLILILFQLFILWALGLLVSVARVGSGLADFAIALVIIIYFLLFWGYFALFEIVWNGQTPGKRSGRLRVIRADGQPAGAAAIMVRNLIRIVDLLPGFYAIGLTVMFFNKDARRLGDLAAGTIVVHEPLVTRLSDVRVAPGPTADAAAPRSYSAPQAPARTRPYTQPFGESPAYFSPGYRPPPIPDPLPGVSLREIGPQDYRLAREMVMRARRGEMSRERSRELATMLAQNLAARMGHDFRDWQQRGWDPVVFLEAVLIARDVRE